MFGKFFKNSFEFQGRTFKSKVELELYIECLKLGEQIHALLPNEHTIVAYRRYGVCPKKFSWLQLRVNQIKYSIDETKHNITWEHFSDYYETFSFLLYKWGLEKIDPVVLKD